MSNKNNSQEMTNKEKARQNFSALFYTEKLTDNAENRKLVQSFDGGPNGQGLTSYLQEHAYEEMENGDSCCYLVKDRNTKEIVAYFSLKCGLLYERSHYDNLNEEDRDFVDLLIDAIRNNDQSTLTQYKESGLYSDQDFLSFYRDAQDYVKAQQNNNKTSLDVKSTHAAIEIQNLCKNFAYKPSRDFVAPIGFQIFWLAIVPKIFEVAKIVGCKYVYLFAADQGLLDENEAKYRLISYYQNSLHFKNTQSSPLAVVRPQYDIGCYEMYNSISELKKDFTQIWDIYGDLI